MMIVSDNGQWKSFAPSSRPLLEINSILTIVLKASESPLLHGNNHGSAPPQRDTR